MRSPRLSKPASRRRRATPEVIDNEAERRFELRVDDRLAGWIDYRRAGVVVALTHVEVLPELRNRGHGETLVRDALADLRRRGLQAEPVCPFAVAYARRHPDEIP